MRRIIWKQRENKNRYFEIRENPKEFSRIFYMKFVLSAIFHEILVSNGGD